MKVSRDLLSITAAFGLMLAALGGGVAFARSATLERSQISKLHWVVPYQVACVETVQVTVTLWDYYAGLSHRDVSLSGTLFRVKGKILDLDDRAICKDGFLINRS